MGFNSAFKGLVNSYIQKKTVGGGGVVA